MKKVIVVSFLAVISLQPIVVSAYGGGSFPPGLPTYNIGVICTDKIINLPFQITVRVPQCKVQQDHDFNQRLRDFVNRVIHGDNR